MTAIELQLLISIATVLRSGVVLAIVTIDYNQGLDILIKNNSGKDNRTDTAVMLTKIYFPELRPALDSILQQRVISGPFPRRVERN